MYDKCTTAKAAVPDSDAALAELRTLSVAEDFREALEYLAESGLPLFQIDQTVASGADDMRVINKISDRVNSSLAAPRARKLESEFADIKHADNPSA